MNQKTGSLENCHYRSTGQMLTNDVLRVVYRVDDEVYTHDLPNKKWSKQTPALQFISFIDSKPTEFSDDRKIEKEIEFPVTKVNDEWLIHAQTLSQGMVKLELDDWFSEEGTVYESESVIGGGSSADPGTGNQGGVEI